MEALRRGTAALARCAGDAESRLIDSETRRLQTGNEVGGLAACFFACGSIYSGESFRSCFALDELRLIFVVAGLFLAAQSADFLFFAITGGTGEGLGCYLLTADPRFGRVAGLSALLLLFSATKRCSPPPTSTAMISPLSLPCFCPQLLLRCGSFAVSVRPVQLEASVDSAKALRVELDKKVCVRIIDLVRSKSGVVLLR